MLHIVKQFMSSLTMGLITEFENGSNHVDSTNENPNPQDTEKLKQEMKDKIDSFNTLEDGVLDSADAVFDAQDKIKDELANILLDLGFNVDAMELENGILISEIKEKIEEKFANQETVKSSSQEAREELSADIISQFENLEWEKYSNFQFNETVQNLQHFLVSQGLLSRGENSTDGKWGPTTRKAFETYKNNQVVTLQEKTNSDVIKTHEINANNQKEVEKTENYQTLEKWVKTSKEEFMWIEFDKLDKNEILKEVHQGTLNEVLAKWNVDELAQNLRTALKTDNLATFTFKNTLGFRNYSDAISVLEGAWYKIKGGYLGTVEALGVIGTIDGVARTQETLKNIDDYNEKLKIIFDYNADGLLDSKTAFYTQEREMFDAVENEQGFENVLKNLGYENLDQFNAEFENNYYSARENFKTQLARVIHSEYVISPNLMIQDPQAREKLNSSLQAIADQADESIRQNAKLQEVQKKYPELSQELQKKVAEQTKDIYLQHLSGSFGEYNGAAATFNVQEITDSILDTASVGMINGSLGLQIWKEVYVSEDGKLKVGVGLVNIYPYVAANYKVNEGNIWELQNLFQRTSQETGYNVNVAAGLSIAPVAGVQVEKMDEDTAEWIEKMAEQMSVMIDKVLESSSFEEFNLPEENRDAYDRLKALQNASGNTQVAKDMLKQGIINNYQRELFRDADSFNVTGVSLGFILKENYLPVLGIHGEMKSQNWDEVDTIKSFEYSSTEISEEKNYATIEKMEKLDADLFEFRKGFSEKTRWNEWSLAVLTPTSNSHTLEDRWNGLVDLSDNPKALRDINFTDFIEANKDATDEQKLAIISKVASWMREWSDITNAKSVEEVISIDRKRREQFNTNFGFDASKYANQYYIELSQMDNLSSTNVHGTGFDAISTLHVEGKHKVSGVDVLHGNLDAIADKNGDMLMIEISDKNDTMAFAETIANTNPELSQLIKEGKVTLYFYKDPDGFDDRILPILDGSSVTTQKTLNSADFWKTEVRAFQAINELKTWSLYGTEKQEDKKGEHSKWDWDTDPEHTDGWEVDGNWETTDGGTDTSSGDTWFDPTNPDTTTPDTWETPTVVSPKNYPGTSSHSKVWMWTIMTDENIYKK